jgi:hypothetical protein
MALRNELVRATAERYGAGSRKEKIRILDEFVALTGFHRKHAMRVLRAGPAPERSGARPGRRLYDAAVREALIVVWEASDRVCGKRLKPLVPVLVGTAWSSAACSGSAGSLAGDERGDDGPGAAARSQPSRGAETPQDGCLGRDTAQCAGSDVRGLA